LGKTRIGQHWHMTQDLMDTIPEKKYICKSCQKVFQNTYGSGV
jgi:transposase-like protein